jgi:hypothetical protein
MKAIRSSGSRVPASPAGLHRREFIALGTACAVAPLLDRLAGAAPLALEAAAAPGRAEPISVGYLLGSDSLASLNRLPWHDGAGAAAAFPPPYEVVPAASLSPVENAIGSTARVRVLGLYPGLPAAGPGAPQAIRLDVLVPSPDPAVAGPLPFFAWSYRAAPQATVSSPSSFPVFVANRGLQLALSFDTAGGATRRRLSGARSAPQSVGTTRREVVLGGDAASGGRLQRGIYLLALAPAVWERTVVLPPSPQLWASELLSVALAVDPVADTAAL